MKVRSPFGSEYVLVPRDAVRSLDEAGARALLDEAAAIGGNAAALAQLVGGELGDDVERSARLQALARALAEGSLVAIEDEREAPLAATTAVDEVADWDADDYVPLTELLPSAGTRTPAVAETEPVLVRVELGALGFDELGVLTLPRAGAGRCHPWAALTIAAKHRHAHPGAGLVLVGHQDAAEPSGHSGLRATALVHFIRNEKAAWVAIAAKWGRVRDTQQLLAYLRQERGWNVPIAAITDVADAATASAVLAFQREANARLGAALFEDGIIGAQTLGTIFDVARADWSLLLAAHGVTSDELAFVDPSCPAIAAGVGFKPYRTVPPLPTSHGNRFVDAIIVPATEQVELGRSPAGAGVYDVASIGTLALDDLVEPRVDVVQLRLFDPDHRPVADLEVTATLGGVTLPSKTTDVDGVVTFELPADARVGSVELGPRLGYPTQGGMLLERGDGEDGEPFSIPDIAERMARLFTSHPVEILVFPPSVDVAEEPEAPPPTVVVPGAVFGPSNPYRLDELSTFWRHGKTGEAFALTDEELELKRATYIAHIRRALADGREFVASVPKAELTRIGGTRHRLRTIAAASFEAMWTAMAAALEADRAAGVASAVATTSVGLVDGYRDADEQFTMWDGRFYGYLWSFKKHKLKDETAATSTVVAKELARYIGGLTGCPGYSNHNDGNAIDIETKVLSAKGKSVRLGAKNRKLWLEIRPWVFDWMSEHSGEHGFAPYEREPWHWNYVGTLEGAVPGAGEDSRC